MSILVAEILPSGIVFAADRNVTIRQSDSEGNKILEAQDITSKVLCWPHSRALIGYVGLARVGMQSMHDWLYDFIGDHIHFSDPATVAYDLRDHLQTALGSSADRSIIQFATFAERNGFVVPEYWHVTNVLGMTNGEYDAPSERFEASERLLGFHLKDKAEPGNVRPFLQTLADQFDPFWFHQGINLAVFNTVSGSVKQAFNALQRGGYLKQPQTLADWERHAKMWVLIYGAYFEAFGSPGQRYVGGGADVLSIPWPTGLLNERRGQSEQMAV